MSRFKFNLNLIQCLKFTKSVEKLNETDNNISDYLKQSF